MFNSNSENFTQDQELIVRRYVNSSLFDIDTFIEYLKNNSIIEFDIFKKSCKKKVSYSFLRCYKPIPRDVFISRLPIYFYDLKDNSSMLMTEYFADYVYDYIITDEEGREYMYEGEETFKPEYNLEPAYKLLDKIISVFEVPVDKVFNYLKEYFGENFGYLKVSQWVNYFELLDEPNENNVFPKNFYFAINTEMEKHGQTPRLVTIYTHPNKAKFDPAEKKLTFTISGYFPLDEEGKLRIDWVGVWFEEIVRYDMIEDDSVVEEDDDGQFFYMHNFYGTGHITIEIEVNEKSRVFALYKRKGDDGQFHKYWEQIYAGTTHSKFSFKPIIKERERLKLSQKEVAEKADINLRSYQRMEAGESIPDALGLIALMNLLDIKNVDTFNRKCRFVDDDYSKFRSGNNPSEYLDDVDK